MKKIFKICAVAILVIVTSCSNNDEESLRENSIDTSLSARASENFYIPKNPAYILQDNNLLYKTEDVYSRINSFQRKITITDLNNNLIYPEIFVTFTSDENTDIYQKLANRDTTLRARMTITADNFTYFSGDIADGGFTNIINNTPPVSNPSVPCNLTTVHDCVSYKIEDMNVIDLGICFATAPACYAATWASCTYDVCVRKIEYTNPIQ